MYNLRHNRFGNGAEEPRQQELILLSPGDIIWIRKRCSIGARESRRRRRMRAIKKTEKIVTACMGKD
jgi:hypothetical protein